MYNVNLSKWHADYKRILIERVGMTPEQANKHLQSADDFDYGYSPLFYITEEGLLDKKN